MVFRRFRAETFFRLLLLSATILVAAWLFVNTGFIATIALVSAAAVAQVWLLIRFVERTNLDLNRFLDAIRYSDFSQSFVRRRGATFDELNDAFNGVLNEFRRVRADREEHHRFLETITQHVGVGLLSFTPDGEIGLINTAAKRLLTVNHLTNLRALEPAYPEIVGALRRLKPGDRVVGNFGRLPEPVQLVMHATEIRLREAPYILVSLQNIHTELEESEMQAWQKLIRVLTHEIMNSVTPISSLASTAADLLDDRRDGGNHAGGEGQPVGATGDDASSRARDLREALRTIEKRSRGLMHFVEAYRSITILPKPEIRIFRIGDLFKRVGNLMETQFPGIAFTYAVDPATLELSADPELVEQVLINLVQNGAHAVAGRPAPKIDLSSRIDAAGRIVIVVADNGCGMPPEVREKIFIPFYTTKRDGSGIGLSLSRQIMRMHNGAINCRSDEGRGSVFTLRF